MSISTTELAGPVDMNRIRDAADGDEEFLRQLIEVFLEDAGIKLNEISAAIAAGDPRGLGRTAHQLKGSSANVGADGLRDFAKKLESLGRSESLAGAAEIYAALEYEFRRVRAHLLPILSS